MRIKKEYDAIIIGGGHMGLTLGIYLQNAGMETAIFERRHEEGSAIFTSECTAPGFMHNLHAQYMEFMDWMPVYHDFNLEGLGARTLYPHAQAGIAFSDGRPPVVLYSVEHPENFEKTYKSIAQHSKQDAETFTTIRKKILETEQLFATMLYNPSAQPTPENPNPDQWGEQFMCEHLGLPRYIAQMTPSDVFDYLFESDELKALLNRMTVEWCVPLEVAGLGLQSLVIFNIYQNWRLMVGGTHTLAHAMEMAGVREGMEFFESSEVVKVILEGKRAVGVELKNGTQVRARKLVASNADIKATLLKMVGEENLSPLWAKRTRDFQIGPSSVLASTALALHEAPDYKSARWNPDINKTMYTVVGFDTCQQVIDYCLDAVDGRVPATPGAGTWVNSLWDPSYAPPGKHALTGWFFMPKTSELTREQWEEVKMTHNDKFVAHFEKWAPNMTWDNIIDHYFYTPLDQEDEMRIMEGDFMNGAIKLHQIGYNRPFPEANQYRTEIEGLYLCGPYMHPGGGVCAAPGYNCFKIIAEDFGLEKIWEKKDRGY